MPRNPQQGTILRNRYRVTNKTRLKIVHGNIEADPLILDEEEERARVIATAGVDADDANEHHLQVAINAAALRHAASANDLLKTSTVSEQPKKEHYIPTPDAAGLVADYEHLYPSNAWLQPNTHVRFSDTVEDTVQYALNGGYSYVMDERDNEWLARNNQEAKGEGTSAQTIMSGATTRAARNARTKGKEAETSQSIFMSEDEFELVMGIFEKSTDHRFPCLHVDSSQIAPFSEYESIFVSPLPIVYFSSFSLPDFASNPSRLLSLAKTVYSHWKDRRVERGGRRITPQLNDDESNENDPYVCFRRRDSKPIRKTRTSQSAITDRLVKLKHELSQSHALALEVLKREEIKRAVLTSYQNVVKTRLALVDLKRRHGSPLAREDEDLLTDKERLVKKPRPPAHQVSAPSAPPPERLWPRDRYQKIQNEINDELIRQRERGSSWEDITDFSYQAPISGTADRLYSYFSFGDGQDPDGSNTASARHSPRYLRLRYGRGGRLYLDRLRTARRSVLNILNLGPNHDHDKIETSEMYEWGRKMDERWRYDCDALPSSDLEDRSLFDDYNTSCMRFSASLLTEEDRVALSTDIPLPTTQPFLDQSRVMLGRTSDRRKLDDAKGVTPLLLNNLANSPPPAVPASVNGNLSDRRAFPGSPLRPSNGVIAAVSSPGHITSPRVEDGASRLETMNGTSRGSISGLNHVLPPQISPTHPPGILQDMGGNFGTPAIARHRFYTQSANMSSQQPNSATSNGNFQMLSSSQFNGSELTPQQIMQLKHAHANSSLMSQQPAIMGSSTLQSMSPPLRPHLVGMNGTTPLESVNINMNLRLPPAKIARRGSPQLNGVEPVNGIYSSTNGSPMLSHTTPIMRTASANSNHLSPSHRGGSSPLAALFTPTHGRTSPNPHMLPSQAHTPSPVSHASMVMSPGIGHPSLPISPHHPQAVNNMATRTTFG